MIEHKSVSITEKIAVARNCFASQLKTVYTDVVIHMDPEGVLLIQMPTADQCSQSCT
jgi:hypothetical protein